MCGGVSQIVVHLAYCASLKNSIFQVLDANANAGIGIIIRRASEIAESKVACALWLIYFGAVGQ